MECLFCRIAAKEIPAHVLYEDVHAIAFLDVMPRTPGHTLVVPKKHAPTLIDLAANEVPGLFLAVQKVDALLVAKLKPDGMTIGANQGRASMQEVDHLHIHLMPRWHNDGGGSIQSVIHNKGGETVEEIKKKILG